MEIGRARLQPIRQIHVRSPRSKSPPCLSSCGTATARSHTKVPYNEPKVTVMRAPPRQRVLQQRALTHGGNTLSSAGFQPRERALDLSNAGGDAKRAMRARLRPICQIHVQRPAISVVTVPQQQRDRNREIIRRGGAQSAH